MLKTSLAGLAAVAAIALPISASAATPKRLKVDAVTGGTRLLGAADVKTLAVANADGSVVLHDDTGARRALPARGDCRPSATGAGLIAWDCREAGLAASSEPVSDQRTFTVLITDLAGLERGRVAVPGSTNNSGALAVGAQWVEYIRPDPNGKYATQVWVNWHTAELMTIDATSTATRPDLDAPGLVAPYCRGVRAEAFLPDPGNTTPAGVRPVQFRAPWAIVDTRRGAAFPSNPVQHRVLRCGSGHALKVPESLTRAVAVALGGGWVAWTPRRGSGATHLMRLTDRRRYMVSAQGHAVFTAGRLWIAADGANLSRATLPRR